MISHRRSRFALLLAVVVVTVAMFSLASPSRAQDVSIKFPINGSGSVTCQAVGSVTFTPPLSTGGTSSTTVKVSAKLSNCTGSGSGATITGGKVTGTITGTPAGDCTVTQMSTSGTLTSKYTVTKGDPKLNPSALSFNTVQAVTGPPVSAQIDGAPTSGSFVGDGSYLDIVIKQSSPCASKWTFVASSGSSFELG